MVGSPLSIVGTAVCATCHGPLFGERYVALDGSFLGAFCSRECLRAATRAHDRSRRAARLKLGKRWAVGAVFLGAFVAPHQGPRRNIDADFAPPPPTAEDSDLPPLPAGWYGPVWPPTEQSLLAALGRDAWVHPLAGPVRRMPRTDSRVFGAARPGDRAIECRNGHCGVDLGGEIWGEHVHAVHDGVVDFVQRGPNAQHGGSFVRLSHRGGTVFTWYFHLAAIPRGLERGVPVKGGDVIGLLGDTGVKESAPHLHFAMSMRAWREGPEKYVDPEPLIALWPLRVPIDGSELGLVTTLAAPSVPLGSATLGAVGRRKLAKRKAMEAASRGESSKANGDDDAAPAQASGQGHDRGGEDDGEERGGARMSDHRMPDESMPDE